MNRYLIFLDTIFIVLFFAALGLLYYQGRLPQSIPVIDLVLLGFAAARLTDVISTDEAMKWLREPFVRLEHTEIAGHDTETRVGRGLGLRRTIGELLSCPWCVGVWIAAGLTYLYFLIPHITWLFILALAVAEIGSILQTITTILVRLEKYFKGLGVPDEGV
jgi:hypothetical protein